MKYLCTLMFGLLSYLIGCLVLSNPEMLRSDTNMLANISVVISTLALQAAGITSAVFATIEFCVSLNQRLGD